MGTGQSYVQDALKKINKIGNAPLPWYWEKEEDVPQRKTVIKTQLLWEVRRQFNVYPILPSKGP